MIFSLALALAMSTSMTGPKNEEDLCQKGRAEILIGMPYNDKSKKLVENHFKQSNIRWIPKGSAITQDYSPDRLNIEIGEDDKIKTVWCG